ncbi:PhoH family protein [bacterium]|nr:PhoH family protein [bacterium]MBU1782934.1 PhoH family protein [bacterium]MBU2600160.1 PhoH family protein [bacterium]
MEKRITLLSNEEAVNLLGSNDENLKIIRKNCRSTKVIPRGNELIIKGDKEEVNYIFRVFEELMGIIRTGVTIGVSEIEYTLNILAKKKDKDLVSVFTESIYTSPKGRIVRSKTITQKRYVEAIAKNDIIICIGPAGTGKTYLAVAMAISALNRGEVDRVILTRPAVEAGEKLGFLPGTLQEKINPYLRPIYDVLYYLMGTEKLHQMFEQEIIEIAPLAFMRGRTINNSFIILDEAQNTTPEQMKMFLTRLGFESKIVITGDITQIDLKKGSVSGLVQIQSILKAAEGISYIYFTEGDVVRHKLVQKIIKAYENYEASKVKNNE